MRHGTPLASRGVPGERGHLSSCIWNLGFFPDDARASHCPFVLTSFTRWSSERCPGIGIFSRGDREIGVLRNVEAPTRPRLECRRETGLIFRCDRKVGNPFQTKQGSRPYCPDQEARKGSEEGVPENRGSKNLSIPLVGAVHGSGAQNCCPYFAAGPRMKPTPQGGQSSLRQRIMLMIKSVLPLGSL